MVDPSESLKAQAEQAVPSAASEPRASAIGETKASAIAETGTSAPAARKVFIAYPGWVFIYFFSFTILLHLIRGFEAPLYPVFYAFFPGFGLAALCALPALLPNRISRPYLLLSYIFWAAPAALCAAHLALFKTPITTQSFFTFFNATPLALNFFSPDYLFWHLCAAVVLVLFIPAWLLQRALKTPRRKAFKPLPALFACLLGLCLALLILFQPSGLSRANMIYDVYAAFTQFSRYMTALRVELRSVGLNRHFNAVRLTTPDAEERTLVVVITATANRSHYGIYGYERNSTPALSDLFNELIIFRKASAFCSGESPCLRYPLSPQGDDPQRPSILTLFKQAGFHTYWLSNQDDTRYKVEDAAALGAEADTAVYLNRGGDPLFSQNPDERILAPLEQILHEDSGRKVIFIPLETNVALPMGFRPEFDRFARCADLAAGAALSPEDCERLNRYDNGIIATDALLKNIIELTERLAPESLLLYFAPSGESDVNGLTSLNKPAENSAESAAKNPTSEVPFFIWLSDGFRAANPDSASIWRQYADKEVNLKDLFYTLCDLAGVTFEGYDPALSFLRGQVKEAPQAPAAHEGEATPGNMENAKN